VTRDVVALIGCVPDVAMLWMIEDAVAKVPGVLSIHNRVVIA
jgi:hypothetical protein